MAVQVATLDILTERAHFDPEVARAIGDAITMELTSFREPLATRQDLNDGLAHVRSEISELRSEVKQEFVRVRTEFKLEMADLRAEFKQDMADLRAEFKQDMAELRAEFKQDLAQEISSCKAELTRWMFGGFVSLFVALLGALHFML
jgi:Protein of unknown function (DUF1640)